ncbi:MAG TPA: flagellar basal body P-ring formation chaperone FlgA, partial [Phycisphaerae bacterium]|nr:flagellar basal body P-ring formation chaperone FlgA [Phycisphaerae bacterium]
ADEGARAIRVWPAAVVADANVLLRDVAEISGFDARERERLGVVIVYGSPRIGIETPVEIDDIREALIEAEINLAAVRIHGSSRCRVSRSGPAREARAVVRPGRRNTGGRASERRTQTALPSHKQVGPRKLNAVAIDGHGVHHETGGVGTVEDALRNHIAAGFVEEEGRVEIRFSPTSQKLLARSLAGMKYRISDRDGRRTGLVSFEIVFEGTLAPDGESGGEPVREALVSAEVSLVRDVVVARRPINQGQMITGRDLKLEERRFEERQNAALFDLAAVVGFQSRRFIRAGEMVDVKSIESRPLVRRGDQVQIVMGGGGVEIRASGQAQSAGALGDVIAVRRDGSRRKQDLIDVTVAGPGLVTYAGPRLVAAAGE